MTTADKERSACQNSSEQYESCSARNAQFPRITFSVFIMSLNTSALVQLGEIEEPESGRKDVNLELARHTIDTIAMLKEKTTGNLDDEENRMIDNILCDLRMRYVRLAC